MLQFVQKRALCVARVAPSPGQGLVQTALVTMKSLCWFPLGSGVILFNKRCEDRDRDRQRGEVRDRKRKGVNYTETITVDWQSSNKYS